MYRTVNDFLAEWSQSADGTKAVLNALEDDKLDQSIVEGHNSLGWLGWHLVNSPVFFMSLVGIDLKSAYDPDNVPTKASEILEAYEVISKSVVEKVKEELSDEAFVNEVADFGGPAPKGSILRMLVSHQIHHRGQMTVLLRQAGLQVPGVMGPTKEEQQ
ncbi:DinB family protein [Oceanobacillus sp. CFH 90083]|uniref:DinB family protein n=1 Tax=Oceanobacillus sp. CFH 90083 TaxID=2592336 RepID=UPI00128BEDA8|nr:DinB family protein [Oceanobacillus sp. CFH 90083]